ncbi:uncharacterized mitochondrial protein AtMg00810-like [Arachis hypogaea]|uniref:uncharacterized mitochondrial protein AtMg00810-like n=1 Tax=Arachis hypogaea TaxID=3818 RepID=UPI000DECA59A|nr:uncharacterized protein LOC112742898 [Arachis hypogaea]
MKGCKSVPTPIITTLKFTASAGKPFDNPSLYRSIVGSLQYATFTRPDIAFSVNKCVKRILRYLVRTTHHGLIFHPSTNLRLYAFSNSDWGFDLDDRRSTCG